MVNEMRKSPFSSGNAQCPAMPGMPGNARDRAAFICAFWAFGGVRGTHLCTFFLGLLTQPAPFGPFRFWILDFGFWIAPGASSILDLGFWILDCTRGLFDFGFWILGFGLDRAPPWLPQPATLWQNSPATDYCFLSSHFSLLSFVFCLLTPGFCLLSSVSCLLTSAQRPRPNALFSIFLLTNSTVIRSI